MKIGILSDIHGNAAALSAVVRELEAEGITRLFVLGDLVGYYYDPGKVLSELSRFFCELVRGNHEDMLFAPSAEHEEIRQKYGHGLDVARSELKSAQLSMLEKLPVTLNVEAEGVRFLLCHGSPWSTDEYIYPDSTELLEKCGRLEVDFVLVGHSHYPFHFRGEKCEVINPGSVGQSRWVGGKAGWAIADLGARTVELRETAYDPSPVMQEAKKRDPGVAYLQEILRRKR